MNFLEQLVAEWCEIRDAFVRTNVRVKKLQGGGYEGELDVVAWFPATGKVVHYETSTDADSWQKRQKRFEKKFEAGRRHIRTEVLKGMQFGEQPIEHVAVFATRITESRAELAGGKAMWVGDLLTEISQYLEDNFADPLKRAVPEKYALLRTLQYDQWRRRIQKDTA
ncbi:MAG: hypothetical protein IT463_10950 [Planctomycetes bacterium]|nr:hypothetical protein [Planctomycetota bacterium]